MACEGNYHAESTIYVRVEVLNPRTHISRDKALYTDYEIVIETNDIAFACPRSSVRRRYSDFQWLRRRLVSQHHDIDDLSDLPQKRFFGRFKRQFLKHRQRGLQRFLEDVTSRTSILSDVAVHLFLQTTLPTEDIESRLNNNHYNEDLLDSLDFPGVRSSRDVVLPVISGSKDDQTVDRDSGFYYSTGSSLSDILLSPNSLFDVPTDVFMSDVTERVLLLSPANETIAMDSIIDSEEFSDVKYHRYSMRSVASSLTSDLPPSEVESDVDSIIDYEADDEIELKHVNSDLSETKLCNKFFLATKSDEIESTVGDLMLKMIEMLKSRPRPSERMFQSCDDSDECFRESEYDVIDSQDDDLDNLVDDENYPKAKMSQHRRRSNARKKINKTRRGKVKSLPNIRFPIKTRNDKSKVGRSLTFHGVGDMNIRQLDDVLETEEQSSVTKKTRRYSMPYLFAKPSYRHSGMSESDLTRALYEEEESFARNTRKYSVPNLFARNVYRSSGISETDGTHTFYKDTDMSDFHHDTNLDTQAEDIAPLKYYDFFKRQRKKSRPKSLNNLILSGDFMPTDISTVPLSISPVVEVKDIDESVSKDYITGRFSISTVSEMETQERIEMVEPYKLRASLNSSINLTIDDIKEVSSASEDILNGQTQEESLINNDTRNDQLEPPASETESHKDATFSNAANISIKQWSYAELFSESRKEIERQRKEISKCEVNTSMERSETCVVDKDDNGNSPIVSTEFDNTRRMKPAILNKLEIVYPTKIPQIEHNSIKEVEIKVNHVVRKGGKFPLTLGELLNSYDVIPSRIRYSLP